MPTPDRTSLADIVAAGRDLLESDGPARLTMQAVADRVGVRAPSLYKRVRNREELMDLIAEASVRDLGARLRAVAEAEPDARGRLRALAVALREFAHAHPAAFHLVFTPPPGTSGSRPESLAVASAPLIEVAGELAGPERALDAARTVTAWANGFLGMELGGSFRLGGDLDAAFDYGIDALARALTASGD
ncbi:TetR/AcrR family transcriptional regulator [Diaminobutyricimonas aerilata]|nr:TetR/AcrR family transcriptional regulator [Diaminobutyricimonas aerilata]